MINKDMENKNMEDINFNKFYYRILKKMKEIY